MVLVGPMLDGGGGGGGTVDVSTADEDDDFTPTPTREQRQQAAQDVIVRGRAGIEDGVIFGGLSPSEELELQRRAAAGDALVRGEARIVDGTIRSVGGRGGIPPEPVDPSTGIGTGPGPPIRMDGSPEPDPGVVDIIRETSPGGERSPADEDEEFGFGPGKGGSDPSGPVVETAEDAANAVNEAIDEATPDPGDFAGPIASALLFVGLLAAGALALASFAKEAGGEFGRGAGERSAELGAEEVRRRAPS